MRLVKPVVKCTARVLQWGVVGVVLLMCIGLRWGLTPIPKPPPGVRLQPIRPAVKVADLRPDNAAFSYLDAVQQLHGSKGSASLREDMDALLAGAVPTNTNPIIQAIAATHPALDRVQQASSVAFCQMPWTDMSTNDISYDSGTRYLTRLICCRGKLAEQAGNASTALQDYLLVTKVGTDCSQGAPLIGSLVANSIASTGCAAIRKCVLQQPVDAQQMTLTISRLRQMQTDFQPFAETLRHEILSIERLLDTEVLTNAGAYILIDKRVIRKLTEAAIGDMIAEAEKPPYLSEADKVARKWEMAGGLTWTLAFNRPFATTLVSMLIPALPPVYAKQFRRDTEFLATEVVCALKSYQVAHGTYPERLNELVPDFLSAVPSDPFDGKPLRYRREGKEWVLWSVGSDLKDDNAAWHEYKYRSHRAFDRAGGDIYFKSTEPQDDLAFYRSQQEAKSKWPTHSGNTPTAAL